VSDAKRILGTLVAIILAAAVPVSSASLKDAFSGELLGRVSDSNGIPQMGAVVMLFDRYQHLVAKTITRLDGRFGFPGLTPDTYSVRISVPRLFPANSNKVEVKAGYSSRLDIHMASLFSSVDVVYNLPTGSMSDDWMWTLRSSQATRPITRMLPIQSSASTPPLEPTLSGTRGVLSFGVGESTQSIGGGDAVDFGTAFAISTDLYGKHEIQIAGNMGQSFRSGLPMAALRATFVPHGVLHAGSPEVTLSTQEIGLRPAGPVVGSSLDQGVALRVLGLSVYQKADPISRLQLEYGGSVDSVNIFSQVVRVSPFARATYAIGNLGEVVAAYSDGKAPTELLLHQDGVDADLSTLANVVAEFPQISLRNDALQLQRTLSLESGFVRASGTRTYAVSGFYEDVHNGRLNVAGDYGSLGAGNVLFDGGGNTSIFNIGRFNRHGFVGSMDQKVTKNIDVLGVYGRMGGFTSASGSSFPSTSTGSFLDVSDHNIASISLRSAIPVSGTRLSASYGWVGGNAIVPDHLFTTQRLYVAPGLNFIVRQPLPSPFGLNGRFELTAELRNLLAQGYVPIASADGQTMLLVQAPRAFRGGVNFIF
jgi:Carboxypeptidase regulatory-like domain